MGVQLNIKDERTVDLARELAGKLGQSVTETIRQALEEKARRSEDALRVTVAEDLQFVRALSTRFRAEMPAEWRGKTSKEIMDDLYDEHGLPQ